VPCADEIRVGRNAKPVRLDENGLCMRAHRVATISLIDYSLPATSGRRFATACNPFP
jgi:hypothetical protein